MVFYLYVLPAILAVIFILMELYIPGKGVISSIEELASFTGLMIMAAIPLINIFVVLILLVGVSFNYRRPV